MGRILLPLLLLFVTLEHGFGGQEGPFVTELLAGEVGLFHHPFVGPFGVARSHHILLDQFLEHGMTAHAIFDTVHDLGIFLFVSFVVLVLPGDDIACGANVFGSFEGGDLHLLADELGESLSADGAGLVLGDGDDSLEWIGGVVLHGEGEAGDFGAGADVGAILAVFVVAMAAGDEDGAAESVGDLLERFPEECPVVGIQRQVLPIPVGPSRKSISPRGRMPGMSQVFSRGGCSSLRERGAGMGRLLVYKRFGESYICTVKSGKRGCCDYFGGVGDETW